MTLASSNDGAARAAILGHLERVTADGRPDHVPPAERFGWSVVMRDEWSRVFA